MKQYKIVIQVIFFIFLVFSCSVKTNEQTFSDELLKVDSYIIKGQSTKALKSLRRLQKKAVT